MACVALSSVLSFALATLAVLSHIVTKVGKTAPIGRAARCRLEPRNSRRGRASIANSFAWRAPPQPHADSRCSCAAWRPLSEDAAPTSVYAPHAWTHDTHMLQTATDTGDRAKSFEFACLPALLPGAQRSMRLGFGLGAASVEAHHSTDESADRCCGRLPSDGFGRVRVVSLHLKQPC